MYEPKDIFNMDRTGPFYKLATNETMWDEGGPGKKKEKNRVIVGFYTNMDRSIKLSPIYCHSHSKKPSSILSEEDS